MENEQYFKQLICDNCENYQGGNIPKGVTLQDYLEMTECIGCGCKKLRRLNLSDY